MLLANDQKLNISSKVENLTLVQKLIEDVCDQMDLSKDHFGNIAVAVSEAVTNAIQHGNKSDPSKSVDIHFHSEENAVSFLIRDEGNGFDYHNLPDPTLPENLEKPNGRGVFLMKNLADTVNFIDSGKCVELKFFIK